MAMPQLKLRHATADSPPQPMTGGGGSGGDAAIGVDDDAEDDADEREEDQRTPAPPTTMKVLTTATRRHVSFSNVLAEKGMTEALMEALLRRQNVWCRRSIGGVANSDGAADIKMP